MPLHDFECHACGCVERNLFFKRDNLPKRKRCPACKQKASRQIFDQWGQAQIDLNNPSLYGYWHPQMGEIIRDYSHKRELMKKYGMEEGSDPKKGNRKLSEEVYDDDGQQMEHEVEWVDHPQRGRNTNVVGVMGDDLSLAGRR